MMGVDETTPRIAECQDCGWQQLYEGSRWKLPHEQARAGVGGHHSGYPDHGVEIRPAHSDDNATQKSSAPEWGERRGVSDAGR
jgi:hypothetical protein